MLNECWWLRAASSLTGHPSKWYKFDPSLINYKLEKLRGEPCTPRDSRKCWQFFFWDFPTSTGQTSQILTTVKVFSKKLVNKSKKCESDRRFSWTKLTEIKLVTQIGVEPHDSYCVIKLITAGSAFNLLKGEAFIIQQKLGNLQKGWCTTWERQMYRCTILLKKSSKQMRAHLFATQSNDG